MLHFIQHDKTDVIPSVSEESSMDASLRSAWQTDVIPNTLFVIPNAVRNPQTILCSNLPNQD
jgi:hypothetical protein